MNELEIEIKKLSEEFDYKEKSRKFLELDRWIGKDPVLMVIDAAGTSSGLNYYDIVVPKVKGFKDNFIESGRVGDLEDLSNLRIDDPSFKQIFPYDRKRKVSIEIAKRLVDLKESTSDLDVLKKWAKNADPYHHEKDKIGEINGVGLLTFQYLRMNAGIDTVKPDRQVRKFLNLLKDKLETDKINTSSKIEALKSCEWICNNTNLRMIDLDQIAWWYFSGKH